MDSKVVRLAAGSLFVAFLLWLAGVAAFWATLVLITFFALGLAVRSVSPTAGKIVMTATTVLAVVTILVPFALRAFVGGTPTYLAESIEERGAITGLQLSERVRPSGGSAALVGLERCKREHAFATQKFAEELGVIDRDFTNGLIDDATHMARSSEVTDKIIRAEEVREECSKRFRGRDTTEIVSSGWEWFTTIRPIAAITNMVSSAWNALPDFTRKSGYIAFLGVIFVIIGVVVLRYHTTFGGGIAAAGVMMVLTGMGDLFSSQNSLFAQLRDGIVGDYNQPWYVTVLALTAIGMLVMALFGVETRIRFSTIMIAVLLLMFAWIARPDTTLGDASKKFEAKLGGINISAPISAVFGPGTKTVPCIKHEGPFRDAVRGQQMRCHRTLQPGESQMVELFGGNWGLHPSDSPVDVTLWKNGRRVYGPGPYLGDRLPVADRVEVRAYGPADIMVSMMKYK